MNKTFPWVQHDSFLPGQDIMLVNFDRGLTSEFEQSFGLALDRADQDAKVILDSVKKQVACRKKQLIDRTGFEISCENQHFLHSNTVYDSVIVRHFCSLLHKLHEHASFGTIHHHVGPHDLPISCLK